MSGNVTRAESEGWRTQRVEMMVDIYDGFDSVTDHEFRTETSPEQPLQNTGPSGAPSVCLVVLCVLLLTTVIVLSVYIYTMTTNPTEEREELLINITNLTEETKELLIKITNLTKERDSIVIKIFNLTEERDQLQIKNLQLSNEIKRTEKLKELLKTLDGWTYYQSSLYYVSTEKKSWSESRRYCTDRGADLIIINNREEQGFLNSLTGNSEFWIGLTDADVEGSWKWVDGTTLNSGFWASGEPDSHKGKNEDCAVLFSSGWYDYPCDWVIKSLCERTFF